MKTSNFTITFLVTLIMVFFISIHSSGQGNRIRQSQKASITQYVGADTQITITYSRPAVKGRTIWGELVPYGFAPGNKYSKDKPFPWRAGANENTTIEINKDVNVEGKSLPAGKYSIHMIPSEKEWIVIFNKNNDQWGSFSYEESADALRVTVIPVEAPFQELLTYGFENITDNSTVGYLQWEKLKIPFKIEL